MRFRTVITALLATVLLGGGLGMPAHAAGVHGGVLEGTASIPSFGTGDGSGGTFTGTLTGVVEGVLYVNTAINAQFGYSFPPATCPLTGNGVGTASFGPYTNLVFDFVSVGALLGFWIKLPTGDWIHSYGPAVVTNPVGNPCGASNVSIRTVAAFYPG